jgi:secreted trypsin-like serine protease
VSQLRFAFPALAIALATGCAVDDGADLAADLGADEAAIIGGSEQTGTQFDAIGTVARDRGGNGQNTFCTGTLVTPRLVLTAESCLDEATPDKVFFIVGGRSNEPPRRTFRVTRIERERSVGGGLIGRGIDAAVLHLDRAVDGVTPLPLADVKASQVGRRFQVFGYGFDEDQTIAVRRRGDMTLRGLKGKTYELTFGSFQRFLDEGAATLFPTLDPDTAAGRAELKKRFDSHKLLEGTEAWFGGVDDADICHGDSGAPATTKINGKLTVVGIGSWTVSCSFGAAFTAVTPTLRAFIDREANR